MTVVYAVPTWVCFMIVAGGMAAVAVALHIAIRARFRSYDFIRHNDVAGFLITVVASLYAVVLGFITVVVWQQYNDSGERNQQEIGAVATAYELARVLPSDLQVTVRDDLRRYVSDVIEHEFPAMHDGGSSLAARDDILRAQGRVAAFEPPGRGLNVVQAELLSHINTVIDRRRSRLDDNDSGIGPLLWTTLVVGAACVIAFSFLFGMENFRVQLAMTALITVVIGTMFVLIMELDYPFRGDSGISVDDWIRVAQQMAT
jgi:hypothetical protein